MPVTIQERQSTRISRLAVIAAWLAILPACNAAAIVCDVLWRTDPPRWAEAANIAALVALAAMAFTVRPLRPLRGYFLALLAIVAGWSLLDRLEQGRLWTAMFAHAKPYHAMLARAVAQALPCALLALTLRGSGFTARDVFLTPGDLRAPAPMPFGLRPVSWAWLGGVLSPLLGVVLAAQLSVSVGADAQLLARALRALPLAVAFAAVNAAQEEFQFRAVLLARLGPVLGRFQALAITSTLFGAAHWFGHPSGPSGVVLAGIGGWLWGKAMLDTRGFAWAWIIHAVQDVVIFTFIVAAAGG